MNLIKYLTSRGVIASYSDTENKKPDKHCLMVRYGLAEKAYQDYKDLSARKGIAVTEDDFKTVLDKNNIIILDRFKHTIGETIEEQDEPSNYLKGYNYTSLLKTMTLIGQIDPWRTHDDGTPLLCLLCSVEDALQVCRDKQRYVSGLDYTDEPVDQLTRSELVKYLEADRILVLGSVTQLQPAIEKRRKADVNKPKITKKRASHTKNFSPERKEQLRQQMTSVRASIGRQDQAVISVS
jgi:hypothetical protein